MDQKEAVEYNTKLNERWWIDPILIFSLRVSAKKKGGDAAKQTARNVIYHK